MKCLRNGTDQKLIRLRHSLGNKCRITTDQVHSNRLCRTVKCIRDRHKILRGLAGSASDQSDRCHGNTLVDDWNTIVILNTLTNRHQIPGNGCNLVVNILI